MEAHLRPEGTVEVTMRRADAVVLHEVLARAEWSGDAEAIAFDHPAESLAISRLQIALRAVIPELGTDDYSGAVRASWDAIGSPSDGSAGNPT